MLVTDSVDTLSYEFLRPSQPEPTPSFPVYQQLEEYLLASHDHPDSRVAHVLGVCAGYSYATVSDLGEMMARMGLAENHCLSLTLRVDPMFIASTADLVQSADGRVLILCYRGTEPVNLISWLADADVSQAKIRLPLPGAPQGGTVHAGFYRNLRATRYAVVTAIRAAMEGKSVTDGETLPNRLEALYVTGHSLGGAMAVLMMLGLQTDDRYADIAPLLRPVYTFGQPMVANEALAEWCQQQRGIGDRLFRFIYRSDVVPHLPPKDAGGYKHFGHELVYRGTFPWPESAKPHTAMGSIVGLAELPLAFVSRRLTLLRKLPYAYSIDDHLPNHYIEALTPPGVPNEFGDDYYAEA